MSSGTFHGGSFFASHIDVDPRLMARAADPLTSHEAAASAKEIAARHQQRVAQALSKLGGKAGAEQIALACGLAPYAARKRLPELERQGVAEPTQETRLTASGRKERIWRLRA